MPHTRPGLQFNFPSVASLKYYPRNEIRAPEYRAQSSVGRRMETWPDSESKRRATVGGRTRRPGSPPKSGMANICPPPLGYLDVSTQLPARFLPSLLCSAQSWRGQPGRAPKPRQKSFSPLPEVTEVQQPGKTGLCIFKTSEADIQGGHVAIEKRHRWRRKKKKRCQMIFVLSSDLEKGALRTQRAVSADFPESVFHIHYLFFSQPHMAGF